MSALAHVDWFDMVPLGGRMLKKRSPASKALRAATLTALLALVALALALGRLALSVPPETRHHNHIGSAFTSMSGHDPGDRSMGNGVRSTPQTKIVRDFDSRCPLDAQTMPLYDIWGLVVQSGLPRVHRFEYSQNTSCTGAEIKEIEDSTGSLFAEFRDPHVASSACRPGLVGRQAESGGAEPMRAWPNAAALAVGAAAIVTSDRQLSASRLVPARFRVCMVVMLLMQSVVAVNPNQQKDWDKLEGMSRWDGIPYNEFRREWFQKLTVSLGAIVQDGWTLLQTARNQDQGAPGNPGNAQQQNQSQNRNLRLFACIMNYIAATCALYRMAQSQFNNDGRALFDYIYAIGHLPYNQDQLSSMQSEWDEATISKTKIAIDEQTPFKWAEYLHDLGDKLGKTDAEKRTRYLHGFPESFDVVVVPERLQAGNGTYVFPANYPAYHPQAGNAHAQAGEPDIDAMARAFVNPWITMLKQGKIKKVPYGMSKQTFTIELSSSDDDESSTASALAVKRSLIDATFVCLACGGRGHAANVDGEECLTRKLGIKIPENELAQTRYPRGIVFPGRRGVSTDDPRLRDRSRMVDKHVSRYNQYTKFLNQIGDVDDETAMALLQKFRKNLRRERSGRPGPSTSSTSTRPFSRGKAKAVTSPPPSSSGEKESRTFHMDSEYEDDESSNSEEATKTSHEVKMAVVFDDVQIQ